MNLGKISVRGGRGRNRTFVGKRRQIYSLLPLAAREPVLVGEAVEASLVLSDFSKRSVVPPFASLMPELAMGLEPATC